MNTGLNNKNALKVIKHIQENFKGKELGHLLVAINEKTWGEVTRYGNSLYLQVSGTIRISDIKYRYNFTKTVEENLKSNQALCQYLLDLFQLTTNN